jgi:hypothetical protein
VADLAAVAMKRGNPTSAPTHATFRALVLPDVLALRSLGFTLAS